MDEAEKELDDLVWTLRYPGFRDARGVLWPFEFEELPLRPLRAFLISAPAGAVRGEHAHASGAQLMICVSGQIEVDVRLGPDVSSFSLNRPGDAIYIASPVWARQRYLTENATLLVFADTHYDPQSVAEG